MHKPHLALPLRPEPETLARRWFSYLICGVAAVIAGILVLMSSPDPTRNKPSKDHVGRIGKLAPGPTAKVPQAAPVPPPPHAQPSAPQ